MQQIETAVSGGSHTAAATAPTTYQTKEDQEATRTDLGSVADDKLIADILSGEYCIQGVSNGSLGVSVRSSGVSVRPPGAGVRP